ARRRGLRARRRRDPAGRAAADRGRDPGRPRRPHPGTGHAARDGPQPRVRRPRRGRHPRALDAHPLQPARGAVRAPDRRGRAPGAGGMSAPASATTAAAADRRRGNWIALGTVARREAMRILRIWSQTLVPPAITMTLYFLIFGGLIGSRIGTMDGISYMDFIVPGLVMMSVIQNSYGN